MPPSKNIRKPVVLVVDDDADIRALFQAVLAHDFVVDVAEDGRAALDRLGNQSYDAVVLDMAMPNKSGLSVLSEIRNDKRLKTTPVLVVSALSPDNELWSGIARDWDRYLQKPVSMMELTTTVNRLLARGRTARAGKKSARKPSGSAKKTSRKPAGTAAKRSVGNRSAGAKEPANARPPSRKQPR